MKYTKITGGLIVAAALLLSTSALAANKSGSVDLSSATQINGKQLPAGTYQLKWEGSGPAVQVQFLKGKKVVATAPAKVEPMATEPDRGAAVVDTAGGSRTLVEARFAGKNYKLVFPSPEAQAKSMRENGNSMQTNQ